MDVYLVLLRERTLNFIMKQLGTILSVITFFALSILITNCNKKDDGQTTDPVHISLPKDRLKAFELALIEVSTSIEDQTQTVNGIIGSESVEFIPNGNYFIFRVPTGDAGTKNGNITINGEDFDFQYELKPNSFSDPDVYLQDYFADQQAQETQLADMQSLFIDDGIPGYGEIQTDLATWNQIANDAQTELAALSPENRQRLAQLLDANSEWIQRLQDALLYRSIYSDGKTREECRALIEQGRTESQDGRYFAAAATAVKAYWCALTFEERQYEDLDNDFERGALLMTDVELEPGFGVLNTLTNLVARKADCLIKELQGAVSSNGVADEIEDVERKTTSVVPFGNGNPEAIFAKIRFRSINENDVNGSGSVGQAATLFDRLMVSYNEMITASDQPLIWRPRFTQSSVSKNINQFLTIPSESVTNTDVVLVNTQYVDDTWEVVFGNDGTEDEPTFSFNLNYNDGYVQLDKTIDATISDACSNPNPCNGQTTVSWGGHTYNLVEIGCQCWFEENLRYTGSIPEVTDQGEWAASGSNFGNTQAPAWCYYDNDPANDAVYGKLYNWFAVNTGTLCPQGWHIPSETDWTILTDYLGGASDAGGKLKATTGWDAPNTGATNSSGFSGLPGGWRSSSTVFDEFYLVGKTGRWWSSTEDYSHTGFYIELKDSANYAVLTTWHKSTGISCRCVKD